MPRFVVKKYTTLILLIAAYTVNAGRQIISDISKPISNNRKDLLIILFTPEAKFKTSDVDFDDISSETSEDSSQEEESEILTPKEDEAYFLYHILRSTENSQMDNKTATKIKRTKEILKPIMRSRCNKLDNCKKSCPKKRKTFCVKKCIMMIDIFVVCEVKPKKKCKKPKCGKTMPPSWR